MTPRAWSPGSSTGRARASARRELRGRATACLDSFQKIEKIVALEGSPTTDVAELQWTGDPGAAVEWLIEAEQEAMAGDLRRHPEEGAVIVGAIDALALLAPDIRAVLERWDGAGYPDRLTGESIPAASRITFVCDAFDAMTSDRPYRRAITIGEAVRELERGSDSQFWPAAVDALLDEIVPSPEPTGS